MLPASLKQSRRFFRQLLISYWLGSTVVIAMALMLSNLREHQKYNIREGENFVHLVASSMRTSVTSRQRQQLLEAYSQASRPQRFDRINVMLVINKNGQIAYSTRPTWRSLQITDPLFEQMAMDDPDFNAVVECFRRKLLSCMELNSNDWNLHLSGMSVVRPVWMPPMDLGLPRQPFLVVVNFDAGMLVGDILQDIPLLLLVSSLMATLLGATLWYAISARMLPHLMEATQTDALTQLMNRKAFMDMAMEQLAEAEENQRQLVFAILDIDHFKHINDTYGHGCGDAALASVGSLLLTVTRPEDLVCRFGGEEFALLMCASRETGTKALERLRLQLEMNRLLYNGHRIPLTVSIGAAATSQCGYNVDFLYNASDKALYAAKHRGRNRLEWNAGELVSRLSLVTEISP